MVPDEQTPAASGKSELPAGKGPRRRSRRGGRRHSRRREPRAPDSLSTQPLDTTDAAHESSTPDDESNQPLESPIEPSESATPTKEVETKLPPLRPAPLTRVRDQQRIREPQPREELPRESLSEREPKPKTRSLTQAIEQVNQIITELRHALDEMDDVLETLELAERQKIDDEREIENLQRALRRLNRPRDDIQHHH